MRDVCHLNATLRSCTAILLILLACRAAPGQAKQPPKKKDTGPVAAPALDEVAAKASAAREFTHISGPGPFTAGAFATLSTGSCLSYGGESGLFSILPNDIKARIAYWFSAHQGRITSIVIAHPVAYTASLDGKIKVWDVSAVFDWVHKCDAAGRDWDKVPIPQAKATWGDHPGGVLWLVQDPESKNIVSSGKDGTVRVWNPMTGKVIRQVCKQTGPVPCISFREDGTELAVLTDKQVFVYEMGKMPKIRSFKHAVMNPRSISFSPDGQLIAIGGGADGKPGQIDLVEAAKGAKQFDLKGHLDAVYSLCFHPKLPRLASVGRDMAVRIYDIEAKQEIYSERHVEPLVHAVYSPDGKMLSTTSEKMVRYWHGEAKAPKKE